MQNSKLYCVVEVTVSCSSTPVLCHFNVSEQQFVRTAKSKGLSNIKILTKHILRNALIPVVTVLGPITAYLVTGSFVVEHIFAIPGIGRFFVFAVSNRDYSVVLAITIVYTMILVFANLIVDFIYLYLDPRIKFGSKS